jgi:nickel-type superoxide dismutase maturation protease
MPGPVGKGAELPAEPRPSRFRRWWSRKVVVRDESMLPTLRPGDRLLVDPRAYRSRAPRAGEIVILVDPVDSSRWLVKRILEVDATRGMVDVRGDAPETARDSRQFGPVPIASIVGRVYGCYYPIERRRGL